jgi:nitroimidazol reductase NimA-like FMN-containing flavoprotein (pyridoxamine 5'-phosphate oxidase superfamily)
MAFDKQAVIDALEPYASLLAEANDAIIAVSRGAGEAPHVTPVWYVYGDGRFYVSITRNTVKYRLMQREPHIALVVDDPVEYRCVTVEAPARFRDDDAWLVRMAREVNAKYRPEVALPSDAELLASRRAEDRVVLVLEPEVVRVWGA